MSDAALVRIRALVDEQAEDEGLWAIYPFGQQPIVEAYLQQELRRLHALVEEVTAAPDAVAVSLEDAEAALRAKAGATTNPAYGRRLDKFLRLVDWARS